MKSFTKSLFLFFIVFTLSGCAFAGDNFILGLGSFKRDKETGMITEMESYPIKTNNLNLDK